MDLARFLQVIWRFKTLLVVGLVLASLVALMSFVRIGSNGVDYREQETWLTASTLLVTQDGFPWGRAILDDMIEADSGDAETAEPVLVPKFGDAGRYSGLAAIYAELIKGDAVQEDAMKGAQPGEYYESMLVQQPGSSAALPMIYVKGYGPTPESATDMARRASKAFIAYLMDEQERSGIPAGKRVKVTITQDATAPQIYEARSFVRPLMLFLLISMVFLALAFALENLRPRQQWAEADEAAFDKFDETWWEKPEPAPSPEPEPTRRSA
jgi:hypothetical protein